jgi:general secretion pathway protein E
VKADASRDEAAPDGPDALDALADVLHWPRWRHADLAGCTPAFDLMSATQAGRRHAVLLREPGGALAAWLADPHDEDSIVWMESLAGGAALRLGLGRAAEIDAWIAAHAGPARRVDAALHAIDAPAHAQRGGERLDVGARDDAQGPAVQLVSSTLHDALLAGASDLHFESTPSGLKCRYRIDGVLADAATLHGSELAEQIVSRIKVLAELDIAERRVPQDGSFQVDAFGRTIDLRVSVMPSIHNEDVVIRVLDKRGLLQGAQSLTLDTVGFDAATLAEVRALAGKPYGMFLVAGPTGSGKTTTLYGAMSELNHGQDKLITIEDPVEYQLAGVLQIPINEKKGLNFARGLRSILRHDPDRIMVGEIRDRETAEIAIQSSLTGHTVLSTVHANSAPDVFGRFANLGVDLASFAAALNGVCAQRLLRRVCTHCGAAHTPAADEAEHLQLSAAERGGLRRGRGCSACRGTGYLGRMAVAEVLRLDAEARELIGRHAGARALLAHARTRGYRTLYEAARARVLAGETTLDEVRRAILEA